MKAITFKNETGKEVGTFVESILVEDTHGKVSKVILSEEERTAEFCGPSEELLVKVSLEENYSWLDFQFFIQSICDYYDRNICQPKFSVYFKH